MMQSIIVYILIAVAVAGCLYYLIKKVKRINAKSQPAGCSGCPLQEHCSTPLSAKEKCQENMAGDEQYTSSRPENRHRK